MKHNTKKIIDRLSSLFSNGFFHVFGAGTINKIVSLCSSIFIVRVLSKEDYGMYGYVINIVNIFMLANGLGTISGMLQFGCMAGDDANKRNAVFHYGIKIGFVVNIFMSIFIVVYAFLMPEGVVGSRPYLLFAAAIPLFRYMGDVIPTYLKTENENKKYGRLYTLNSVTLLCFMLIGAYFFNVYGVLGGRYVANIITVVVGIAIATNCRKIFRSTSEAFPAKERKKFLRFSIITCIDNVFSQLLYNIDVFVIGIVIGTTISIASYKAATTIPFALSFISTSVITYVYPIFVRNLNNMNWIREHYKKLVLSLFVINGVIAVTCFVLAPFIIQLVFGSKYLDAVPCFRILIFGYWISSSFRVPGGNVLSMLLQAKANMVISISSGVLNIILDVVLIRQMGSIGAAIATTTIYIVTSIASNVVLHRVISRGEIE